MEPGKFLCVWPGVTPVGGQMANILVSLGQIVSGATPELCSLSQEHPQRRKNKGAFVPIKLQVHRPWAWSAYHIKEIAKVLGM